MFLYVLSFCHGWDRHFPTRSWIKKLYIFFTGSGPQVFIQLSILHCFPPRHGMQQAHHFLLAPPLRQVVGCLASVDRSWWHQCCCFSYDLQALRTVKWWDDIMQPWLELSEMRFAQFSRNWVQLMKWRWMKPNHLPTRLFQVSRHGSSFFCKGLKKQNLSLRFKDFWLYPSMLVLPTLNFEKLGSRADHINSDQFSNENHVKTWWDFLLVWSINIFQGKCSKDRILDNETWLWSVGGLLRKISLSWGLLA